MRADREGDDMRVVSLVPSSTETLLALGAEVIACTRFCEQPGIPHVGGTKNPDVAAIVALRPDLVVMDREENRIEDHDALVAAGVHVIASDVRSVDDALELLELLTESVGASPSLVERCRERLDRFTRAPIARRTAFVPIWRRPWMSIGSATYGASLLDRIGIDLVTSDLYDAYPAVELDDIGARNPELVLVPSEPYDFSDAHLDELRTRMPTADVVRVDGKDLFWWGVRTSEAVERLGAAF